jgi:hypothetical protein
MLAFSQLVCRMYKRDEDGDIAENKVRGTAIRIVDNLGELVPPAFTVSI